MLYQRSGRCSRVAMRVGSGPGITGMSWLIGDHLGSTSVIANSSGTGIGGMTYKPWGEGTTWGTVPTKRLFTGQILDSYINLYWFNSRWFDPTLGRFIQPDNIIPNPGNPASYDRYSYSINNPINFIDPSGHSGVSTCRYSMDYYGCNETVRWSLFLARYSSISIAGQWDSNHLQDLRDAIESVGNRLADLRGGTPWEAFNNEYEKVEFKWDPNCSACRPIDCGDNYTGRCKPAGGAAIDQNHITFASISSDSTDARNNVVHELGHLEDYRYGISDAVTNDLMSNEGWPESPMNFPLTWRQHPCNPNDFTCQGETFADMFLGWVFGNYGSGDIAEERKIFMIANLTELLTPNLYRHWEPQ